MSNLQTEPIVTTKRPAITMFRGLVYTAWTAAKDENKVFIGWYTDEGAVAKYIDARSAKGPALAADDRRLYIAWTSLNEKDLYVSWTENGTKFDKKQIGDNTTSHSPALTYFRGHIYIAFTGGDGKVWVKRITNDDGHVTTEKEKVKAGEKASGGPSLAVHQDSLYVVWPRADYECGVASSFDGKTFQSLSNLTDTGEKTPALASTNEHLYW